MCNGGGGGGGGGGSGGLSAVAYDVLRRSSAELGFLNLQLELKLEFFCGNERTTQLPKLIT
jgi:hypothetical protein